MNIFESIKKNIPNAITCMNLLCGSVACIMALRYKEEVWWGIKAYEAAFIMIALAAVFDFFDGFVARLLHVVSAIGKELDSLCDCVSFGFTRPSGVCRDEPFTPREHALLCSPAHTSARRCASCQLQR